MVNDPNKNLIILENIVKDYRLGTTIVHAVKGVSLEIRRGEFLSLSGPSGSGKTTLLNIIGCIDSPTCGSVYFSGQKISSLKERDLSIIRSKIIGFIFQAFNLIPVLSAYENVDYALTFSKKEFAYNKKERIMSVLHEVGLEKFVDHKPGELSGGQRQRVAIARALVKRPKIILADEPTANLDSKTGKSIIDLMLKINREEGTTFIFSTHDSMVTESASRIINMRDGVIAPPNKP